MITEKYKKDKMWIAKRIFIFSLIFIAHNSFAQQIQGTYYRTDPMAAAMDGGITFTFKEDQSFERIKVFHMGLKEVAHGKYVFKGDTLILNYEKYTGPQTPIEITKKEKIKTSSRNSSDLVPFCYIKVKVYDQHKEPQSEVLMVLQNEKKEPIMAFWSDSKGHFPELNLHDDYTQYIQLTANAKHEVLISTDSLFGFLTEIDVSLSTVKYNFEETVEKVLVKDTTPDRIEGIFLDKLGIMVLERAKE